MARNPASATNGLLGGRPPGKSKKTLEKEAELERIKQRVFKAVDVIIDGQIANARGLSYLYKIEKDDKGNQRKPELVVSQSEIEEYLSGDTDPDNYYYITTSKPETQAAMALLDRAFGKPSQAVEMTGKDGKDLFTTAPEKADAFEEWYEQQKLTKAPGE